MNNADHHQVVNTDWSALAGKLARRLQEIYKEKFSEGYVNRILDLMKQLSPARPGWDEKDIIIISYANSINRNSEKPLKTLSRFMQEKLSDTISCIHILPFFPSTSDDGFAVSDYWVVDPHHGDWDDITAIGANFSLMADLVINHVSASHVWVSNFLTKTNPGIDFFIEKDPEADYSCIVRPRTTQLFTKFDSAEGQKELWTTFSADQIDLNFSNPEVLIEMIRILLFYIRKGIRIIRLDAVAFIWKTKGTPCVHLPEAHEIIKLLREIVDVVSFGTLLLTETNVPDKDNRSYFGNHDEAHMVYQFTLPPLLIYTLLTGNSGFFNRWANEIPIPGTMETYLNFTASHDGIGIRPLEGILSDSEIHLLIQILKEYGGLVSEKTNADGTISPYEVNITYYDALKGCVHGFEHFQDKRFICSQTVMLSLKGIPAFYIQSMLGAGNDYEGVQKTHRARSINRRPWQEDEINTILSTDTSNRYIFNELKRLTGIRKNHSAFHPSALQKIISLGNETIAFKRHNLTSGEEILCISNITPHPLQISLSNLSLFAPVMDLILPSDDLTQEKALRFEPYQTRWLIEKNGK
jgi:sucrose phosphorylase